MVRIITAVVTQPARPSSISPAYLNSLAMKPKKGGRPALEKAASATAKPVSGMWRISPPSSAIWRVPVAWSMAPTAMNSAAL